MTTTRADSKLIYGSRRRAGLKCAVPRRMPAVNQTGNCYSVPQFVKTIDPLRGLTLADGRRLTLRWAHDLRQFGQDAMAEMQLTIDEAQQLLEAETVIDTALQAARDENRSATAYLDQPPWLANRPRFARSTSRRHKTNCERCAKLGAKCWQHRGQR